MATERISPRPIPAAARVEDHLSHIRAMADALFVLESSDEARELHAGSKFTLMEMIGLEAEAARKIVVEISNDERVKAQRAANA